MGELTDKVTGRAKQAAGDITGDEETRREGVRDERKGEAKGADQRRGRQGEGRHRPSEGQGFPRLIQAS